MSEDAQQQAFEAEVEVSSSMFDDFIAKNRINMRQVNAAAVAKPASKYSDDDLEKIAVLNAVSISLH
jgi:hypothetical protein